MHRARVLFLDHVGALGGAELALVDVAAAYRDTSTVALLADGPLRDRLAREGVRVEIIPGGEALHRVRRDTRWPGVSAVANAWSVAQKVRRLARDHDCIHANSQKAFAIGCLAGAMARRPVVWDLNDLLVPEHFSRTNIRVDVALANGMAARVIANSQASADALVARGGRRDKVRVVHQGIRIEPFDRVTRSEVEVVRRQLGLTGKTVAGLFGRLSPWKGQDVALEALTELPDVHLLLVGNALFGEAPYEQALRRRCADLSLTDRVHFIGFRDDVPALMTSVDVVVHASTAPEPFGRVIVEGMLARRPVVATRAGGVEEIIRDGETGLLVAPGDPRALAKAIRRVLHDQERTGRMVMSARADAERRFTVDAMVLGKSRCLEEVAH